jgi:ribosomal protein S18 acetylase RimI-like enzyme
MSDEATDGIVVEARAMTEVGVPLGLPRHIQYLTRAEDTPRVLDWMLALTRANMRASYEQVWGWDEGAKDAELRHEHSRFFVIPRQAFVHFRYEWDEDGVSPVVYVYEIQVEPAHRGRSLGHTLMRAVEDLGRALGFHKVKLTVFSANVGARRFYRRLGYDMDVSSPDESTGYLILSRETDRAPDRANAS